jgi:hypothetical protein
MKRRDTIFQLLELYRLPLDRDHLMTYVGEASGDDGTDIAAPNHRYALSQMHPLRWCCAGNCYPALD